MYSLDCSIKSFAVANESVKTLNKVCYQLGKTLKPFCVCADKYQLNAGVMDLSKFAGFINSNMTLLDDIAENRKEIVGVSGLELTDDLKKTLFYHYLMSISICYVEVETWKTVQGERTITYDKYLCTRNPAIMGAWMGCTPAEMQAKYMSRIANNIHELSEGTLRYVKFKSSAKGNTITCPRSFDNIGGMKCVPLFMLNAWVTGIKENLLNNLVKFTFLKDNHTEREMVSTLSEDIMRKYYNDNNFISLMLSGIDIDQNVQGGMHLSSKINRGYVKLPEMGTSIYDSTGTRSLNLARVLKVEKVDNIDTMFIYVSLGDVVTNFCDCIEYCGKYMPDVLSNVYRELIKEKPASEGVAYYISELSDWARRTEALLSTQFQRTLHTFLVSHPDWFPLYTGTPNSNRGSANFGAEEDTYGDALPMDF